MFIVENTEDASFFVKGRMKSIKFFMNLNLILKRKLYTAILLNLKGK